MMSCIPHGSRHSVLSYYYCEIHINGSVNNAPLWYESRTPPPWSHAEQHTEPGSTRNNYLHFVDTVTKVCYRELKEHVALDRSSWSFKSVCNRFVIKCIWLERCLKREYNDSHTFASKLRGFPFN